MNVGLIQRIGACAAVLLLALAPMGEIRAHGGGNWNSFTIAGVNDDAHGRLLEVRALVSEVIRGRIGGEEWPVREFRQTRDALITVKEEVDEIVAHFVFDGVNIQVAPQLRAEPGAGRTVAAHQALDASIALIDHATSLDSAETFIKDFYAGGLAARLYELLDAHVDRMELYATLTSPEE